MELYCSTGAFVGKINNRNHLLIPEAAQKLNCEGQEFLVCSAWYEENVYDSICEDLKGIDFPVIHLDKEIGSYLSRNQGSDREKAFKIFEENCRIAKLLGVKKSVLHLWGAAFSDKNMEYNLSAYPLLKQISENYGVQLTVENVPCNTYDPFTHWRALIKLDPDVKFTLDTRFMAFHGQFDEFYEGEFVDHIDHIHISDWSAGIKEWDKLRPIPHPGEGNIDFDRFFNYLAKFGYKGSVSLESPSMLEFGLNSDSLNRDLDFLRNLISSAKEF